jgi:hypothetical protein
MHGRPNGVDAGLDFGAGKLHQNSTKYFTNVENSLTECHDAQCLTDAYVSELPCVGRRYSTTVHKHKYPGISRCSTNCMQFYGFSMAHDETIH